MKVGGARPIDPGAVLIVGGGTVGLFLALALSDLGTDVVLLEAGGERPTQLEEFMVERTPQTTHQGVLTGWANGLGGTSQLWGGQLWPWEAEEFSYLDEAGQFTAWPTVPGASEYGDVGSVLRVSRSHSMIHDDSARGLRSPGSSLFRTRHSSWLPRNRRNFGQAVLKRLRTRANVTIYPSSVVRQISIRGGVLDEISGEILGVPFRLEPGLVVLAAGTLENSRLLLGADLPYPQAVGRFFMDHLSGRVAEFSVSGAKSFELAAGAQYVGRTLTTPRFVPTDRSPGQLGCFGHWEWEDGPGGLMSRVRDVSSSVRDRNPVQALCSGLRVFGHPLELKSVAGSLVRRSRPYPRDGRLFLRVDVEQPPRRCNALSLRPDGRLVLEWAVGEPERARVVQATLILCAELQELPGVRLKTMIEDPPLEDTKHLMGGTRMGTDVSTSVVDAQLRVHGVVNLWVAGASIFPSGGIANPTLTALALALHLARTLSVNRAR